MKKLVLLDSDEALDVFNSMREKFGRNFSRNNWNVLSQIDIERLMNDSKVIRVYRDSILKNYSKESGKLSTAIYYDLLFKYDDRYDEEYVYLTLTSLSDKKGFDKYTSDLNNEIIKTIATMGEDIKYHNVTEKSFSFGFCIKSEKLDEFTNLLLKKHSSKRGKLNSLFLSVHFKDSNDVLYYTLE